MAGGIFASTNKVRPGAYINFKSVPKPMSSVGNRGNSYNASSTRLAW